MLQNEKYYGSALLQKHYTTDFLTHKVKKNEGELSQYYIENSHPAIISKEQWDLVQIELERRSRMKGRFSPKGPLASRLVCADCGAFFGAKTWHSSDPYKTVIWRCNDKYKPGVERQSGGGKCNTGHVTEERVMSAFYKIVADLTAQRPQVLEACDEILRSLLDTSTLDDKRKRIEHVDELAEVGAIGQDVAYLLRTHPTVKEATAEVVSNDVDSLTPDMLTEIYEKAVAKKAEQVIGETITPQLIRLKQQAENNKERAIAAEEELKKQQYKDTMRIRNLESMAQAKSDKVVKCISKAGLNLLLAVRVFIVGYFLFSLIKGLSHDLWSNINAFTIGNALLAVLCAIDYFVPKMHWGDRWIKKFANWCGDCIYKREINKGKKYLEMK